MNKYQLIGVFSLAFGGWLSIHCPRAAMKEFKSGIASGLNPFTRIERDFARKEEPFGFWLTILGTFLAGVMGLIFVIFGIAGIIWG